MTTSATADLTKILARTRHLLLDFDGPICASSPDCPHRTRWRRGFAAVLLPTASQYLLRPVRFPTRWKSSVPSPLVAGTLASAHSGN